MQTRRTRPPAAAGTPGRLLGQALAEFAVILVVLMLVILGIVDLSRWVYIRSVVANAAREGARFAAVEPPDADRPTVEQATKDWVLAKAQAGGVALSGNDIIITWLNVDEQHKDVQVQVSCVFHPATGLILEAAHIGSSGIELRGDSRMRREK